MNIGGTKTRTEPRPPKIPAATKEAIRGFSTPAAARPPIHPKRSSVPTMKGSERAKVKVKTAQRRARNMGIPRARDKKTWSKISVRVHLPSPLETAASMILDIAWYLLSARISAISSLLGSPITFSPWP